MFEVETWGYIDLQALAQDTIGVSLGLVAADDDSKPAAAGKLKK